MDSGISLELAVAIVRENVGKPGPWNFDEHGANVVRQAVNIVLSALTPVCDGEGGALLDAYDAAMRKALARANTPTYIAAADAALEIRGKVLAAFALPVRGGGDPLSAAPKTGGDG